MKTALLLCLLLPACGATAAPEISEDPETVATVEQDLPPAPAPTDTAPAPTSSSSTPPAPAPTVAAPTAPVGPPGFHRVGACWVPDSVPSCPCNPDHSAPPTMCIDCEGVTAGGTGFSHLYCTEADGSHYSTQTIESLQALP